MSVAMLMSGFFAGEDYYIERLRSRGVGVAHSLAVLRSRGMRGLRRLHMRSGLPGYAAWFEDWERTVDGADTIIVHASDLSVPVAGYIHRRWPRKRLISWYWNPAGPGSDPGLVPPGTGEVWSFDRGDCRALGLSLNTTYSFRELGDFRGRGEVDFLFVGSDKGRAAVLADLARRLEADGYTYRFCVAGMSRRTRDRHPRLEPIGPIPYVEILRMTGTARAVVEIPQAGQRGSSLRPVEAVLMGRSVLSLTSDIRAERLYDPERVFIVGRDRWDGLEQFVERASAGPVQDIVDYYDFSSWIRRFDDGGVPL